MPKIDKTLFLADGENDKIYGFLSLVKLTGGKKVKDIIGHAGEVGEFTIFSVVLEDGTSFLAGGSHDNPYLYSYAREGNDGARFVVDLDDLRGYDDEDGDE